MATGALAPVARQQFFDANGNPLAGGRLYWYVAGTSTPSPAYSDEDLLIPLTNPVVLDAGGWAPAMYLGALTYKAVLTNALGVTLWTQDDIASLSQLIADVTDPRFDALEARVVIAEADIDALQASLTTLNGHVTPEIITLAAGTHHNIALNAAKRDHIIRLDTSGGSMGITGFGACPQGSRVYLQHVNAPGANTVSLYPEHAGSLAANRLTNFAASGATPIFGGTAEYLYDAFGRWRLQTHHQGGWITLPYSAANFTAAVGTWTVVAGNQTIKYWLSDRTLRIFVVVSGTSVSNATGNLFVQGFPYIFAANTFQPFRTGDATQGVVWGMGQANAGQGAVAFWAGAGGTGWAPSSGATSIEGQYSVEVT